MTEIATLPTAPARPLTLVERTAAAFAVDPEKLLHTLRMTCFRTGPDKPQVTNEQMMALLIVREQYNLNPFTKELFAFDDKRGGIIPYVSVDGWSRIVNEHAQFDGMEFAWDEAQQAMTCIMWRKDRSHSTVVTEYMTECKRNTEPWTKSPRRMLRHKSLMQCARLAFGFAGIYDRDEAEVIRDGGLVAQAPVASTQRSHLKSVLAAAREHFAAPITDVEDASQAGDDDGPGGTVESLTAAILAAPDRDAATEILDRARSILSEDDLSELAANFSAAWDNV
ncbi:hypothetical protein GCM10028796_47030 [Ramlibacter monticola]|uniref:Phage recombination protein Bet n=2 Tax=Ramlibacter monticola TaxID=1926872 RepID=A0A936Z6P4_9BURK|nr:phage recombination protein Bet [Ramlibacter monticola]